MRGVEQVIELRRDAVLEGAPPLSPDAARAPVATATPAAKAARRKWRAANRKVAPLAMGGA